MVLAADYSGQDLEADAIAHTCRVLSRTADGASFTLHLADGSPVMILHLLWLMVEDAKRINLSNWSKLRLPRPIELDTYGYEADSEA